MGRGEATPATGASPKKTPKKGQSAVKMSKPEKASKNPVADNILWRQRIEVRYADDCELRRRLAQQLLHGKTTHALTQMIASCVDAWRNNCYMEKQLTPSPLSIALSARAD